MLYNQNNLDVAKIASKSETRPELASVLFKSDRTVATDSFRLLEVSAPAGVKPEEFPTLNGASAMRGCSPFMVSAKGLKEIKIPKVDNGLPILQNMAIKHLDNNRVEFLTTDLETAKITTARRVEGKFPDYEAIFPTGEPAARVSVNGRYLAEVMGLMSGLDRTERVELRFYGPEKPIVLAAGNDTQRARGLVMPLRG